MSDESDFQDEETNINIIEPIPSNEIIEHESDNLPGDSTINPVDEESQFIYDEDMKRLLCVGTNFSDIPHSIIDSYAQKTTVKNAFDIF
jgi:hypothetical protein